MEEYTFSMMVESTEVFITKNNNFCLYTDKMSEDQKEEYKKRLNNLVDKL